MIRYCADDIGLNPEQIRRVADCAKNSALNVASVFGNSPFVAESIAALRENCALALHFNLSEGKGLSAPAEIPLLAKADGSFYQNFLGLLLLSLARPKGLEEQVRIECAAQLGRFLTYMPEEYRVRIDSHRHVHLIPAVFRGVCRALQESGRETEHLRWPVERVSVYLRLPRVWPYIRPENMLKVILLKLCSLRNEKLLRQQGLQTSVFCGIVFAGCMTDKAVIPALGRLKAQFPALTWGEYKELSLTTQQYAFARTLDGKSVITALNNGDNAAHLEIPLPVNANHAVNLLTLPDETTADKDAAAALRAEHLKEAKIELTEMADELYASAGAVRDASRGVKKAVKSIKVTGDDLKEQMGDSLAEMRAAMSELQKVYDAFAEKCGAQAEMQSAGSMEGCQTLEIRDGRLIVDLLPNSGVVVLVDWQ